MLGSSPAAAEAEAASATNAYDQSASEVGSVVADTALLVYQEDDHRVRAIESETGLTWNAPSGMIVSGKFTYDTLTGATPNGAIRSRYEQTFVPPRKTRFIGGGLGINPDTHTGASGRYTVAPNQLPVDKGFKDHREAYDLGVTFPLADGLKLSVGGAASSETDFSSYSARASLAKDMWGKNTTLSLGFNYERDGVRPFTGVPRALSYMGDRIVGGAKVKQIYSLVVGVTQVLTPRWLIQLNYSYGDSRGYHTDPYKIFTLVDVDTGDPFFYIYEKRPDRRERSSIYGATKFALGSAVTDASVRWYHDSWGVNAMTYAVSEHAPVGHAGYVEPGLRFYRQTAARFFAPYLGIDVPTPPFVSADSRLSRFRAWTFSLKAGAHLTSRLELYGAAERYVQEGRRFDRSAPGVLAQTDLFNGTRSTSLISGLRYTWR
ncbi:hypothetical protein AQZ52_02790 [Novosphingobium fuchskuhlense]|uniref:TonB-dependent receptor-like beta-barrel domain-containing protein n=1 Tax=Novosphingobium fuchskuhlense TaxID=1117702 RepID=A0A124JVF4_9SPHN|nr:DUF3570 domain-containing protein [Novosphingobium fuchskuhlense]KUR72228.1 hypothetical protein AQZ52_02790 [Novosphingobium fuchskuhlense]